jgi:hypothetical protein
VKNGDNDPDSPGLITLECNAAVDESGDEKISPFFGRLSTNTGFKILFKL